jgi:hypothetical protein
LPVVGVPLPIIDRSDCNSCINDLE